MPTYCPLCKALFVEIPYDGEDAHAVLVANDVKGLVKVLTEKCEHVKAEAPSNV